MPEAYLEHASLRGGWLCASARRQEHRQEPGIDHLTALWSNGQTLWVGENGDGAADALYTHDTASKKPGVA